MPRDHLLFVHGVLPDLRRDAMFHAMFHGDPDYTRRNMRPPAPVTQQEGDEIAAYVLNLLRHLRRDREGKIAREVICPACGNLFETRETLSTGHLGHGEGTTPNVTEAA